MSRSEDGERRPGVGGGKMPADDGGSDGAGVPALLILVGAGLFVFPEPATSAIGAALVLVGAVAWFVDAALN